MNVETIKNYQLWAARGYVDRLTCPHHPFHDLIPMQVLSKVALLCPRMDFKRELGLNDYRALDKKAKIAEMLFNMKHRS